METSGGKKSTFSLQTKAQGPMLWECYEFSFIYFFITVKSWYQVLKQ